MDNLIGICSSVAVLSAIGVDQQGLRRALGLTVALSEAEICWKEFLERLVERGLCGIKYIVFDDHTRLNTARRAVFPNATWQPLLVKPVQECYRYSPHYENKKVYRDGT